MLVTSLYKNKVCPVQVPHSMIPGGLAVNHVISFETLTSLVKVNFKVWLLLRVNLHFNKEHSFLRQMSFWSFLAFYKLVSSINKYL